MDIITLLIVLFILLAVIVVTCYVFTNAVEDLGCKLHLSQGAVGSVLAAVGTALPETLVPLVAILGAFIFNGNIEEGGEIGVGAILGAPFLLGTLAFCLTGLAVYYYSKKGRRSLDMPVNTIVMKRDMLYFMSSYIIAVGCSFIPENVYSIPGYYLKVAIALFLLFLYGRYVYLTIIDNSCCDTEGEECVEPPYLSKLLGDKLSTTILQLVLSVLAIIILAHFFVETIKEISHFFHISPLILSLIIAPIATELPEKFNSIIWIRAKKDTLALGNITGAMVFQSCIPPVVGILLTPWVLDFTGLASVILVYIATILVYFNLTINKNVLKPWILVISGVFYVLYLVYLLLYVIPGG